MTYQERQNKLALITNAQIAYRKVEDLLANKHQAYLADLQLAKQSISDPYASVPEVDEIIDTMVSLINHGVMDGEMIEYILSEARRLTENDSHYATWNDNYIDLRKNK